MLLGTITIVDIKSLKPHEKTWPENLKKVKEKIEKDGYIANPIIVDKKTLVILDGHHRAKAVSLLGYKKVPAYLVDYFDPKIRVFPRRKNIEVSKEIILHKALAGKVFPYKTSKHLIPSRPKGINIPLFQLK